MTKFKRKKKLFIFLKHNLNLINEEKTYYLDAWEKKINHFYYYSKKF